MSVPRQIAIGLVACLFGMLAAGVAAIVMLDGAPVSVDQSVPIPAITTPMIGVIIYWLVGRALRVALEPIRTFVFGAIVVYGTFYLSGVLITYTPLQEAASLGLAIPTILAFAVWGIHVAASEPMEGD